MLDTFPSAPSSPPITREAGGSPWEGVCLLGVWNIDGKCGTEKGPGGKGEGIGDGAGQCVGVGAAVLTSVTCEIRSEIIFWV